MCSLCVACELVSKRQSLPEGAGWGGYGLMQSRYIGQGESMMVHVILHYFCQISHP